MTPKPMQPIGVTVILVMIFLRSTRGNNFAFVDCEKTYDDANAMCEKFGFILARVNNMYILSEIVQMVQQEVRGAEFWIGMRLNTSDLPNFTYVYETGEPAYFTAWADKEPNNQDSDQCVRIQNGEFKTIGCTRKYYFMCQNMTEELTTADSFGITSVSSLPSVYYHTTLHGDDDTMDATLFTTAYHNTGIPTRDKALSSLEKRLENIRSNLTIDKTSLTLNKMRLVCATDDRTSSYSIGMVGAAIIFIVIAIIIIGDVLKLLLWWKQNWS